MGGVAQMLGEIQPPVLLLQVSLNQSHLVRFAVGRFDGLFRRLATYPPLPEVAEHALPPKPLVLQPAGGILLGETLIAQIPILFELADDFVDVDARRGVPPEPVPEFAARQRPPAQRAQRIVPQLALALRARPSISILLCHWADLTVPTGVH